MENQLKKCKFCGEEIKAEAVKCRFCNEWLEKKTTESKDSGYICDKCGADIAMNDRLCPKCGNDVSEETEEKLLPPSNKNGSFQHWDLLKGLSESQKLFFFQEYNKQKKSLNVAYMMALFLGGIGAHHFYLGYTGLGFLYTIFCWTFVPVILAFFELLFLRGRVDRYNRKIATEIIAMVKLN